MTSESEPSSATAETVPPAAETALDAARAAFERGDYAAARRLLAPLLSQPVDGASEQAPDDVGRRARDLAAKMGGDRRSLVIVIACAIVYAAVFARYVLG